MGLEVAGLRIPQCVADATFNSARERRPTAKKDQTMTNRKTIKLRDVKPAKDPKGGRKHRHGGVNKPDRPDRPTGPGGALP